LDTAVVVDWTQPLLLIGHSHCCRLDTAIASTVFSLLHPELRQLQQVDFFICNDQCYVVALPLSQVDYCFVLLQFCNVEVKFVTRHNFQWATGNGATMPTTKQADCFLPTLRHQTIHCHLRLFFKTVY